MPVGAEGSSEVPSIKTAWSAEVAASQFEELCDRFEKSSPAFVKELRKKRPHYIAFLKYPDAGCEDEELHGLRSG